MIRALGLLACMAAVAMSAVAQAGPTRTTMLSFSELAGWHNDDLTQAFDVFRQTCGDMDGADWKAVCAFAETNPDPREFFELLFRPVLIEDGAEMLFTGYFEPELNGSRHQSARFAHPLYRLPPEVASGGPWLSRTEIETGGLLQGRGLEIAWIDDPVDVFFLQVQGSGRVRLQDGSTIRVGYAGANGHRYRSIGQEMVRRGIYQPHQVSADVIQNWVRRNPQEGQDLLRHNPSYVFFREVNEVPPDKGPLGAMNRSVTPMRTVAVDPAFTPLGAPVWIEKAGKDPMNRLMIAQDTGSAIKGAQRADIFFGTGDRAGRSAGAIKDGGRMVVLLPIETALALENEGTL